MREGQSTTAAIEAETDRSGVGRQCLLVLLQPKIRLAKNLQWPLNGFVVDNTSYHDAGFGDWTEFYDWLRDKSGKVLGVRYWLRSDTEFLVGYTRNLDYIEAGSSHYIEIFFSDVRTVDPKLSGDQDFLYDALFRSKDGMYAIGFGMGGLSEPEIRTLESSVSVWAEAVSTGV